MKVKIHVNPGIRAFGADLAPFLYPSAGNPRVAVLVPGFRETRQVRYFATLDDDEAVRFDPEVLAGTAAQLRWAALRNWPVKARNGIVVLTYEREEGLSDYDRDILWDVFGVPVFEQYFTRRNRLLASECDAHEGLHLSGSAVHREGWLIEPSPCACGDARPRLMPEPEVQAVGLHLRVA